MRHSYKLIIGIDAGTNTGFSVYDRETKKLTRVCCGKIHTMMDLVKEMAEKWDRYVLVRVEDARKAVHGRMNQKDISKAQGAGSIKRDAAIWEDFLTDLNVPFEMVRPNKRTTKLDAKLFEKITGWGEKTNEHARDAAMICFGF